MCKGDKYNIQIYIYICVLYLLFFFFCDDRDKFDKFLGQRMYKVMLFYLYWIVMMMIIICKISYNIFKEKMNLQMKMCYFYFILVDVKKFVV